jgi:hypothetical protein
MVSLARAYKQLRASVREQAVMHTDDTGWRVGCRTAFLMAFVNPSLAVYQIRNRHRNEEVRELVPGRFRGRSGVRPGQELRRRRTGRCSAAEMSVPSAAQCFRSGGKENGVGQTVQPEAEGSVAGGDGAPGGKGRNG